MNKIIENYGKYEMKFFGYSIDGSYPLSEILKDVAKDKNLSLEETVDFFGNVLFQMLNNNEVIHY